MIYGSYDGSRKIHHGGIIWNGSIPILTTVDGSELRRSSCDVENPRLRNGIKLPHESTGELAGFLNHQQKIILPTFSTAPFPPIYPPTLAIPLKQP